MTPLFAAHEMPPSVHERHSVALTWRRIPIAFACHAIPWCPHTANQAYYVGAGTERYACWLGMKLCRRFAPCDASRTPTGTKGTAGRTRPTLSVLDTAPNKPTSTSNMNFGRRQPIVPVRGPSLACSSAGLWYQKLLCMPPPPYAVLTRGRLPCRTF